MAHLLDRVHLHLPEYHRVRNATLVRDLTKPDTLSNTLQVKRLSSQLMLWAG